MSQVMPRSAVSFRVLPRPGHISPHKCLRTHPVAAALDKAWNLIGPVGGSYGPQKSQGLLKTKVWICEESEESVSATHLQWSTSGQFCPVVASPRFSATIPLAALHRPRARAIVPRRPKSIKERESSSLTEATRVTLRTCPATTTFIFSLKSVMLLLASLHLQF